MANRAHPEPGTALEIFAHTHIGGAFIDPSTGTLVINAGMLHPYKKSPTEPLAFATLDLGSNQVRFHEAMTGKMIVAIPMPPSEAATQALVCPILLSTQ